jgi:outer membrane lipoprotein SlyB
MKTNYVSIVAIIIFAFTGCDNKDTYVDLETGKTITVVKDSTTGHMINAETKEPVGIYVNTATNDTIYGRTGKVINNLVVKSPDGKYTYKDESEIKVSTGGSEVKVNSDDGDYKKKVEKDGDIKIKDGDTKIKIEADGEKKVKRR